MTASSGILAYCNLDLAYLEPMHSDILEYFLERSFLDLLLALTVALLQDGSK
jgi:hypothetical protein